MLKDTLDTFDQLDKFSTNTQATLQTTILALERIPT
jgi:hypothetical protein